MTVIRTHRFDNGATVKTIAKWVIHWVCCHCDTHFIEERTAVTGKDLFTYEIGQTTKCNRCGQTGCDAEDVLQIESPKQGSSSSNLFGGIRP